MLHARLFILSLLLLCFAGTARAQDDDAETDNGIPASSQMQPETPIDEWTGKTVLLIGAHPDDDSQAHGTLAMLQDHGNDVHILIMTTGNVGTKDPTMTRDRLSKIRRQEQVDAMAALGIPEENYINLGYTDGKLEFADREEVVRRLVRHIRELKPDVLFAFEPGYGYQTWHKTDHRAAAYLAADAARAAEWRLLYPGQVIHDGLEAHWIQEYLLFGGLDKDKNVWVDISDYEDQKIESLSKYISQFSAAWSDYRGPSLDDLEPEEREAFMERVRSWSDERDGRPVEGFRYYRGIPDRIGARLDHGY